MTVTRATTATRVNSDGLIEAVPYNLLQYSEQFDNASWTKTSVSVTANTTTAPNGTLTADKLTPSSSDSYVRYLSFNGTAGSVYTFSFYAKADAITNIRIRQFNATELNGTINFITIDNEWQRFTVTSTCAVNQQVQLWVGGSSTWSTGEDIFIWGAQLVQGSAPKDYFPTTDRLNVPRIDYSNGGCPSILVEPQRTNLLLRSEEFDNASWTKVNTTITPNNTLSPNGLMTAYKIEATATSSTEIRQDVVVNSTFATLSFYIKKGTSATNLNRIQLRNQSTGTNLLTASINLDTKEITYILGSAGVTVEDSVNGWLRIIGTVSGITSGQSIRGSLLANGNSVTIGEFSYIWGAQLEAGAYATSYIPTTSASVTRNADVISRGDIFTNGLITASGGTWFVDLKGNVPLTRDTTNKLGIGDNTSLGINSLYLLGGSVSGSASRILIQKRIGGTSATLHITTTDTCKIAIKWNGATADVFENGVKVLSATAFTPTAMEYLMSSAFGVSAYINSMALFPTPLSDTECISLTTL
jgi:hypothetical protein